MTTSEFQDQQAMVLQRQAQHQRLTEQQEQLVNAKAQPKQQKPFVICEGLRGSAVRIWEKAA